MFSTLVPGNLHLGRIPEISLALRVALFHFISADVNVGHGAGDAPRQALVRPSQERVGGMGGMGRMGGMGGTEEWRRRRRRRRRRKVYSKLTQ